jgi:hypothetical protein
MMIKSRKISCVVHVACMEENRYARKGLVGKREGSIIPGRWEDKCSCILQILNWINLARDRDQ